MEIISPTGKNIGRISYYNQVRRSVIENTKILSLYGQPSPYSMKQEIYIEMIPEREYIAAGIWKIRLISEKITGGRYDMWLPSLGVINEETGFLYPSNSLTCTCPSTASRVISVGAYDSKIDSVAGFSGRGYIKFNERISLAKPEIVAPGVNIELSETKSVSGTSKEVCY